MSNDRICSDDPKVIETDQVSTELGEWISILEARSDSDSAFSFACLVKSALRAYRHLNAGWKSDSTHTAWACRNLFELRVFARYLAISPENRERFLCDMTVDTCQSNEAVVKMAEREDADARFVDEEVKNLLQLSEQLRIASGFRGSDYLNTTKFAKDLGLEHELSTHKLCSKLIHPTAQSILLINQENRPAGQDERDALFLTGCRYLKELNNELVPYFKSIRLS